MTRNASPRIDNLVSRGVDANEFREGMSRLGAAVSIVTTVGSAGPVGFTASAVCSVTDAPPTLLVCLNRSASVYPAFERAETLCVNALSAGQEHLGLLFGGKIPMNERFACGRWTTLASDAPTLQDAAVSFDCRIAGRTGIGSHDVLFCQVMALKCRDVSSALVYFRRQFHPLPPH